MVMSLIFWMPGEPAAEAVATCRKVAASRAMSQRVRGLEEIIVGVGSAGETKEFTDRKLD